VLVRDGVEDLSTEKLFEAPPRELEPLAWFDDFCFGHESAGDSLSVFWPTTKFYPTFRAFVLADDSLFWYCRWLVNFSLLLVIESLLLLARMGL